MNLVAKSVSVLAAVAAFAVPAVASAHPTVYRGGWGGRVYERGWVAPRVYAPRVYYRPQVYAPPVYGPRVYVAPRAYAPRAWVGPRWGWRR